MSSLPAIPPDKSPVPRYTDDGAGASMSFFEHLEELRDRIIRVVGAVLVALILSSFFVKQVLDILIIPCECQLILLKPTDGVIMYLRVALLMAAIATIPITTYQVLMFVMPGMTRGERNTILKALPVVVVLFLVGVAFAWFILVPTAIPFLRNFMGDVFRAEWTAGEYIAFLTSLMFWMGVAFEMPALFFVLARIGLVEPRLLIDNWRLAVVIMSVIAAVITPTVDPFNMMLVIVPLLFLYVLSIFLTKIAYRNRIEH